jgi:hypothetical protein
MPPENAIEEILNQLKSIKGFDEFNNLAKEYKESTLDQILLLNILSRLEILEDKINFIMKFTRGIEMP